MIRVNTLYLWVSFFAITLYNTSQPTAPNINNSPRGEAINDRSGLNIIMPIPVKDNTAPNMLSRVSLSLNMKYPNTAEKTGMVEIIIEPISAEI